MLYPSMSHLVRMRGILATLIVLSASSAALAQQPVGNFYNPNIDVVQQGAAFGAFIEPGAPTIDVSVVNLGGSSALFRVGEETTLTQILVLSGTVAGTEENERFIVRSTVSVLRGDGQGGRAVIYSAAPDQLFREPGQHPQLQTGDVVEIDNTYERLPTPFTFREGLQLVTSVLSLASTIALLVIRL